ncbi:hypothetical protein MIDIC_210004 [Alphaproteobacteria bacterium]
MTSGSESYSTIIEYDFIYQIDIACNNGLPTGFTTHTKNIFTGELHDSNMIGSSGSQTCTVNVGSSYIKSVDIYLTSYESVVGKTTWWLANGTSINCC